MSDHIQQTLDELKSRVTEKQQELDVLVPEVNALKIAANQLCKVLGRDPIYAESSATGPMPNPVGLNFRIDQFTGKTLSEAVAEYLEMRKGSGSLEGPATVDEIYQALRQGGFKFETVGDENSKRAIKISLTKTTALFTRVSDGVFGLKRWYGMRGPRRPSAAATVEPANDTSSTATEEQGNMTAASETEL